MALVAAPIKAPPPVVCDWAELKVLSSPNGEYRLSLLRRLWDTSRETEDSDPEGLTSGEEDTDRDAIAGEDVDRFFDSIATEISDRKYALGESYPFEIASGSRLRVLRPSTFGGYMYLFCLFLTYSNGHEVLDGTWLPQVDNQVRDLFQACSTVAAAGEVQGCAVSFGWPRPDNAPFLKKLREVYERFGEGVVVERPWPGVSPHVKDEEIDVIAWKPQRDRAAGTTYLLGQVASGDNWEMKSIKGGAIENFHVNWFIRQPPSTPTPAIFIPHAVPPVQMSGTRQERMAALTARFGQIMDRMRLPAATDAGVRLSSQTTPPVHIERLDDLHAIADWVVRQIAGIQGAAR